MTDLEKEILKPPGAVSDEKINAWIDANHYPEIRIHMLADRRWMCSGDPGYKSHGVGRSPEEALLDYMKTLRRCHSWEDELMSKFMETA